jgi:hypothetical protein
MASHMQGATSRGGRIANLRKPAGAYIYPLEDLSWNDSPRTGVRDKAVRRDPASGLYLGAVAFEPLTRSGLHQHRGTALSYFLSGALTDYQGTASAGMAGINFIGATHDAISYGGCLLAARLEGPVVVPDDERGIHPIRNAAGKSRLTNPAPGRWPDLNIPVEELPLVPTPFAGIGRRMVFDYAGTGDVRRMAALTIMPHSPALMIEHSGLTDWFVLAGEIAIGNRRAPANSFAVIEPGSRLEVVSEYGCLLLAWAEGPGWGDGGGNGRADLYGF